MRRSETGKPRCSAIVLEHHSRDLVESGSGEPTPQSVGIVSDRPIYARAIQTLLYTGRPAVTSYILFGPDLARPFPSGDPDVMLLMPQDWSEFATWLPCLRRRFAARPWLLLADWRLAGMFLSLLSNQPCAVVEPGATDHELGRLLERLVVRPFSSPTHELLARFARGSSLPRTDLLTRFPTAMELQCGCAVSFGLRDAQIAGLLQLSEATVKSHVHHFLRKLGLRNRVELGELVRSAFAPRASLLEWASPDISAEVIPRSPLALSCQRITVGETVRDCEAYSPPHHVGGKRHRLVRKEVLCAGSQVGG
jgi:DNA-binding NarL/FixJ family response regulator